jgi:hypothetical protein
MALTRYSNFEIRSRTALLPTCGIAPVRNLELGESGDVSVTAQYKNNAGVSDHAREQKAIGALGQDLLSSSLSLTWVRKTISLPGRSGASRTSRTLNP